MRLSWLAAVVPLLGAMRLDPERIAARLRIEREIENDAEMARGNRGRRQLQPKEISIQVTAPLFSSRLFEYGKDAGDTEIPQSLDVGKKVQLTRPLNFYGEDYNTLYVLSNGAIGFDNSARSYKASLLPGGAKMIAPFWNRNDLRNGGHVYYREVTKGRVLERGQSEIRYQYDKSVKVTSAIIVTWEKMQPLGAAPLPDDNTNTFQSALFITDNGTYANFIYSNIGWTQGAEAGFNRGDGKEHYALPTSGTGNIMYLEEYGNTGIPGEWMFQLGEKRVTRCKQGIKGDTCDEECGSGEWGADCASCCHCGEGGSCHPLTGECPKGCGECWTGTSCQTKKDNCKARQSTQCAPNAISYTDYDRCGEPIQRCNCLAGFTGDGYKSCIDIDECKIASSCHSSAICTNTPGRFFCQCPEGFSGDGVTACESSVLYPSQGHQALPKSKNAKVAWQLKNPLTILGEKQEKLTITTSGLISLSDISKLSTRLDEMDISGVAAFFAPIDTSKGGEVTVAELTDSATLTRVTRMVREHFGETQFHAKSALVVTYSNVTDGKTKHGNTFQTLLIGGSSSNKEPQTYVELIYKDMPWGDGAEAGIMSNDVSSSVSLPGSGTQGLEQLPHLSNIHQPGIWMFRIDPASIRPCPLESQLPPYCDETSTRGSRVDVTPKPRISPAQVAENLEKKSEDLKIDVVPVGQPRVITPTLDAGPRRPSVNLPVDVPVTAAPIRSPAKITKPRPQFESTPHKPLVSLGAEDFNIDPDVFEEQQAASFAPFVTVIPEVFTGAKTPKKLPDFTIKEAAITSSPSTSSATKAAVEATFPNFALSDSTEAHVSLNKDIEKVREPAVDQSRLPEEPIEKEKIAEKGAEKEAAPADSDLETKEEPAVQTTESIQVVKSGNEEIVVSSDDEEEDSEVEESEPEKETDVTEETEEITTASTTPSQPIFVFTATAKTTVRTTSARPRPVIVTAKTATTAKGEEVQEAEASPLALYIPLGIVFVWLALLVLIAVVVCCKRRSSSENLRAMYGPTYGVHPTAYAIKRGSKHNDSSYEDHLEKAARLSSEMSAYNQSGRVSQYGSYWNLNNSSSPSSSGPSNRQSPPFNGYHPRYSYTTARY